MKGNPRNSPAHRIEGLEGDGCGKWEPLLCPQKSQSPRQGGLEMSDVFALDVAAFLVFK